MNRRPKPNILNCNSFLFILMFPVIIAYYLQFIIQLSFVLVMIIG